MNKYKNKIGYHNPISSEILFNQITKKTNILWIDTSYHNDNCDSMEYNDPIYPNNPYFSVYLPNSIVEDEDNEKFTTFCLMNTEREVLYFGYSIDDLCHMINNLKPI